MSNFGDAQPLFYCSTWLSRCTTSALLFQLTWTFRDAQPLLYCSTWLSRRTTSDLLFHLTWAFRDAQPLLYCSTWLSRCTTSALLFHLTWTFGDTQPLLYCSTWLDLFIRHGLLRGLLVEHRFNCKNGVLGTWDNLEYLPYFFLVLTETKLRANFCYYWMLQCLKIHFLVYSTQNLLNSSFFNIHV